MYLARHLEAALSLRLLIAFLSVYCASAAQAAGHPSKPAPGLPAAIVLSPCNIPDVAQAARCGVLDVPENPNRSGGRRLSISVVVLPAIVGPALPDPIVPLMGGPGEDAISAAAEFADRFAALRRDRDLLLVDQRGTGRSGSLAM